MADVLSGLVCTPFPDMTKPRKETDVLEKWHFVGAILRFAKRSRSSTSDTR